MGKNTTVTISKELYSRLREYANKHGYNVSRLVSILIERQINIKDVK